MAAPSACPAAAPAARLRPPQPTVGSMRRRMPPSAAVLRAPRLPASRAAAAACRCRARRRPHSARPAARRVDAGPSRFSWSGGQADPSGAGRAGGGSGAVGGSRQVHGREPAGPACAACAPDAERARPRTSEEPTRHARAGRRGRRGLRLPQARGGARKGRGGRKPAPPVWIAAGPGAPTLGFLRQPGVLGRQGSPVGLLSLHESRANVDRTWQGGEYDGLGSNRIRPNPSTAKAISLDLANVLFGQGVRPSHYFDIALPSLNPGRPESFPASPGCTVPQVTCTTQTQVPG